MFDSFFLSRQTICNPLVTDIITAGHSISQAESCSGAISSRYGNRMIITGYQKDLGSLTPEDLVEIADYDLVRRVALVIGPCMPSAATPLHWLLYRREDIYAIAHLYDPATTPPDDFPSIKEILTDIKTHSSITLGKNRIAVGKTVANALEELT